MNMDRPATYFISHGAPSLILEETPGRAFLSQLSHNIEMRQGRPRAILCISAHWETPTPAVSLAVKPETIHDFYGFPEPLYHLRYPVEGAVEVAEQAAVAIEAAGLGPCQRDTARGLDHGAWSPLMLAWPDADIPVAQISIQPHLGPVHHLKLGRTLQPLVEDGVLILASGGAVHNLRELAHNISAPAISSDWAKAFDDWLTKELTAGNEEALLNYREVAPHAVRAHPRDEHFLPLFVAYGAAGPGASGQALHRSFSFGTLSLSSFAFS